MVEKLKSCERTARKRHVCSYCGSYIEKGEKYEYDTLCHEGNLYDWKSHKKCSFIAKEIYEYVDPDEGMTGDNFREAVQDLCHTFICPKCERWDEEAEGCGNDYDGCINKLYGALQKNELYLTRDKYGWLCWKLRPGERKDNG